MQKPNSVSALRQLRREFTRTTAIKVTVYKWVKMRSDLIHLKLIWVGCDLRFCFVALFRCWASSSSGNWWLELLIKISIIFSNRSLNFAVLSFVTIENLEPSSSGKQKLSSLSVLSRLWLSFNTLLTVFNSFSFLVSHSGPDHSSDKSTLSLYA